MVVGTHEGAIVPPQVVKQFKLLMFKLNPEPAQAIDAGEVGGVCVKNGEQVGVVIVPGTTNEFTGVHAPKPGPLPPTTSRARKNIVEPGQKCPKGMNTLL